MILSASGYGSGRSRTALTMLKMAVLAPMPSASVRTATKVNPGDLRSWRRANFRSFILFGAQCLNGVDKCGAARRDQTRHQCGDGQYNGGGTEQKWIVWRNLIKLSSDQPTERECRCDSDDQADNHRSHSLIDDQAKDVPGLRAERHPHPDLARPLFHRVSHRTVNPDRRQQQRHAGKNPQ